MVSDTSNPEMADAPETTKAVPEKGYKFRFHGTTEEFFRIWIVNLLLTIATLGIYSAWAKVRTNQYFYQSTEFAGSTFNYIANPIAILKGRAIAIFFLAAYALCLEYAPIVAGVLAVIFVVALPWVVTRGLAFRAAMTQWRNVRFRFHGTYVKTALTFGALLIVVALTFGLAFPWAVKKQKEYLVSSHSFGGKSFATDFSTGSFYGLYIGLIFVGFAASLIILGGNAAVIAIVGTASPENPVTPVFAMFSSALSFSTTILVGTIYVGYYTARMTNLIYGNSSMPGIRIVSTMEASKLIGLYFINVLAMIFTLGLAYPWAKIRIAKYKAETLGVFASVSLEEFIDEAEKHESAIGEEIGEVFDIDIAI